jgi:ribosome biogenesis GTPase A
LALVEWALEAEMTDSLARLVERAEQLITHRGGAAQAPGRARLDAIRGLALPQARVGHGRAGAGAPWRRCAGRPEEIDAQKDKIERNTRQFVEGRPANNVLLTGARGTGKSSLIKACLNALRRRACA